MTSFNLFSNAVSIIKNGQKSLLREVSFPFSNLVFNFLNVLKEEGYIETVETKEIRKGVKVIFVRLKYYKGRVVIADIRVISKPSKRVYWSVNQFKEFYNGLGMFVISTSAGIFPAYKASKMNIGGEVLCALF
ncbi:MAG: 30S ribosomal protein S8 [Rickettsiaceae bacterium H1]|nr:30S ribosomal protein S8 [Rickettsiaceae bacterium H1]